jgi:hypothetical protein
MWKNIVEPERPQIIWRMRIACWITKATNKHTQNGLILIAFPLQQWLNDRASMLRSTYTASLVNFTYVSGTNWTNGEFGK